MVPRDDGVFVRVYDVEHPVSCPVWLHVLGHVFNKIIYILGLFTLICLIGKAIGFLP